MRRLVERLDHPVRWYEWVATVVLAIGWVLLVIAGYLAFIWFVLTIGLPA